MDRGRSRANEVLLKRLLAVTATIAAVWLTLSVFVWPLRADAMSSAQVAAVSPIADRMGPAAGPGEVNAASVVTSSPPVTASHRLTRSSRRPQRTVSPLPLASPSDPSPSGATGPAPLNFNFDAESINNSTLVPNLDFEQVPYTVGTPPTNYNFATGDLTGWSHSGSVSVFSGGPSGYYAQVGSTGRITSTAFTVASDSQTFTLSASIGTNAGLYIYVASGSGYSTLTQVVYAATLNGGAWTTIRFDASQWRGQSIEFVARGYVNSIDITNIGVANVVAPQWDGAGVLFPMTGGPTGNYVQLGGQSSNVVVGGPTAAITSTAFTVPADGNLLKFDAVGPSNGQVGVYVFSGPNYGTSTFLGAKYTSTAWQTLSFDISAWAGQSIKIKVYQAYGSYVAVDNVGVVESVLPNWSATKAPQLVNGGPWGNYAQVNGSFGQPITSTAFTIPAQATAMQVDILGGGDVAEVYILSGPAYGASTMVLQKSVPSTWERYTFGVSQWAGQSVKIVLWAGTGTTGWVAFDNVGANLVEGDYCGCGKSYPSANLGNPVDTSTGAESLSAVDLTLPGRGVPIEFSRSYFSMSTYTGTLGSRWMDNYEMNISVGADLTATVRYASGGTGIFKHSGSSYISPPGNYDTLVENGDGTYTLTSKGQIKYNFPSGGGQLQSIQDRDGNTTTLSYTSGQLSNVTDAVGRSITMTYDISGRLSTITDPLNRTVQYGYSADGDLITVTNMAGEIAQYTYDNHRLVSAIDNAGKVLFQNYYDNANRVITQTEASAYTTTFAYDTPAAGETTVTDPRGNSTIYFYDTGFRTGGIQDPYGNDVTNGYDANDNVITATNQLGQSTLYSYDSRGNVTGKTDALGNTTIYTYTALNDLAAVTDPSGTTSYGYDSKGNVISTTNALGQTTMYGRDSYGELTVVTNTLGYTTTYDYDSYGNPAGVTNALGERQAYSYDVVGRNISTTDPLTHTTSFQYDGVGRVLTETNPLNQSQSFGYDAGGHGALSKWWDPSGNETQYGRNTEDWLTSVQQTVNESPQSTSYNYDPSGDLSTQTFASYAYDKLNRPITVTDSLGKNWVFGYDAAGELTSRTDPDGYTTHFDYDAVGHLITITYPIGDVVYGYDAAGNRTSMQDSNGNSTDYTYDALNRLTSVNSYPSGVYIGYDYDAVGNRNWVGVGWGGNWNEVFRYSYDAANRLTAVTDPLSHTTRYGYDDAGRVISSTLPNGVETSYGYDSADRLTSVNNSLNGTSLSVYTYTLDANGNRTKAQDLSATKFYTYNEVNWLKNETLADGSVVTYTNTISTGNRATKTDGSGTTSYTYNGDTLLTQAGATYYYYDDDGNLTCENSGGGNCNEFAYDYANRMTQANYGTASYSYDGDGLRIGKSVNGVGDSFVWDVNQAVPQVISDSNYVYTYGLGPIGFIDPAGNAYYFLKDGLGSVTGIVDTSGVVTATYDYDVYGNLVSSTGTITNALRYAGQWYDGETGFYYLRARYYDPTVGRFTQRDTWPGNTARPYSLNPYLYVEDNPVNFVDPAGLWPDLSGLHEAAARLDQFLSWLDQTYQNAHPAEVAANQAYALWATENPGASLQECRQESYRLTLGNDAWVKEVSGVAIGASGEEIGSAGAGARFSADQQALIELAKEARSAGGISVEEARTLLEWAREYDFKDALDHIGRTHWVGGSHVKIGPINHIPVIDPQ